MDAASERFSVVVVGGGQAGLAAGYHLAKRGIDFVILDAEARTGEAWRRRWDSLRLFTPAQHDGLPGVPFPASVGVFPTKDEVADYLEAYAQRFDLPIRHCVRVTGLSRAEGRYLIHTDAGGIEAGAVIVATGANQVQRVPDFAPDLGSGVLQIASNQYRTPEQLRLGGVLVVGAGTSGAEIAMEAAQHGHRTWLSGPSTGRVPAAAYAANGWPFWWFATHVLTVGTPIGRKMRAKMLSSGAPLINLHPREIVGAGVTRVGRTVGVRDGMPVIDGGEALDVTNVVWCTGYRHDFGWVDLPLAQDHGMPAHERGVIPSAPGLYFLGLPFLTGFTSSLLGGVGRDAEAIVDRIGARVAVPAAV